MLPSLVDHMIILECRNDTESVNSATDALNGDHYAGVTQAFNNITWNTTSVNDLKQFIESAPLQLAVCAEDGVSKPASYSMQVWWRLLASVCLSVCHSLTHFLSLSLSLF